VVHVTGNAVAVRRQRWPRQVEPVTAGPVGNFNAVSAPATGRNGRNGARWRVAQRVSVRGRAAVLNGRQCAVCRGGFAGKPNLSVVGAAASNVVCRGRTKRGRRNAFCRQARPGGSSRWQRGETWCLAVVFRQNVGTQKARRPARTSAVTYPGSSMVEPVWQVFMLGQNVPFPQQNRTKAVPQPVSAVVRQPARPTVLYKRYRQCQPVRAT